MLKKGWFGECKSIKTSVRWPFHRVFGLLFVLCLLFSAESVYAKRFQNAYVSFELPDHWDCHIETSEWTCQGKNQAQREAIIVLAAKEVGMQDSLAQYMSYLQNPKQIANLKGSPMKSDVSQTVKKRKIANHEWVDGQHLHSELPYYYTRYLATTKKQIAVLVTFSAKKSVFSKYSYAFIRAINSLQVTAVNRLGEGSGGQYSGGGGGGGGSLGGSVQSAFPIDMYSQEELPAEPDAKKKRMKRLLLLLLLGVGSIAVYFFLSKRDN